MTLLTCVAVVPSTLQNKDLSIVSKTLLKNDGDSIPILKYHFWHTSLTIGFIALESQDVLASLNIKQLDDRVGVADYHLFEVCGAEIQTSGHGMMF
jgi:hypothetical protein